MFQKADANYVNPEDDIDWDTLVRPDPETLARMIGPLPADKKPSRQPFPGAKHVVEIKLAEAMISRGMIVTSGPKNTLGKANVSLLVRLTGIDYKSIYLLVRHPTKVRQLHLDTIARITAALNCRIEDWLIFRKSTRLSRQLAHRGLS